MVCSVATTKQICNIHFMFIQPTFKENVSFQLVKRRFHSIVGSCLVENDNGKTQEKVVCYTAGTVFSLVEENSFCAPFRVFFSQFWNVVVQLTEDVANISLAEAKHRLLVLFSFFSPVFEEHKKSAVVCLPLPAGI